MEFNVLIIVSFLTAFVLTLLSGRVCIEYLKKKMFTQYILEDAPANHAKKAGTPSMGGLFIVLPAIAASFSALVMNRSLTYGALITLASFLFFMPAGLSDDLGKIRCKQNKGGLSPKRKLFLQIAISALPALYVTLSGETYLNLGRFSFDLGWFYPFFAVFFITGVSNAVNLTDGLDGLASSNFAIAMAASVLICTMTLQSDLAIIAAAAMGACIGFLYYNRHPAQVFMGDTGSLALGGLLGALAVIGKFELWLALIGLVFCLETLSVIIQVISFKTTGKRVFKMSPLHHHFELSGWSENKIVIVFSLVSLVSGALAVLLFKFMM